MPWINEDLCVGCGVCADDCPVSTISMVDEKARISMDGCIHCGICHGVCSQEAVRHDSERIPELVEANVEETKRFMQSCADYLGDAKEKDKCLQRMKKYFMKEKIIAEKTLEKLEKIQSM